MKNLIIITGGAGFVGSNLIEFLIKKTKYKIISIDNYSTGSKKNHIKSLRVKYIKGNTLNIEKLLKKYKANIHSLFHFGEFARIFQSFKKFDECFQSNTIGSMAVFKFCLDNNIKLIYSATSASLGNNGNDKNLSPYAFTKSKNLELLDNLKKCGAHERPGAWTRPRKLREDPRHRREHVDAFTIGVARERCPELWFARDTRHRDLRRLHRPRFLRPKGRLQSARLGGTERT